ncbi:anthranilate synthase component I [Clostridium sp. DL1XJH146]
MKESILVTYSEELNGDKETPITLYEKYVGEDIGFLLETYDIEHGRYSFIGKNPSTILKMDNQDEVIVKDGEKKAVIKGKALSILREYMKNFKVKNTSSLPFIGGAVGTVGYDVIRQYENLPNLTEEKMDIPLMEMMITKEMIVFDHHFNKIILLVIEDENIEGKEKAQIKLKTMKEIVLHGKNLLKNVYFDRKQLNTETLSNTTKNEYKEMVEKAKKYIFEGDIFQVVLSQKWEKEIMEHPFTIYRKLRSVNPSPYLYYLNYGEYQVVGSSPEMLVKLQDNRIYTCPIAGTRKRGKTTKEDKELAIELLNDEKEKAEHAMLVDLARNDTGRVSTIGTVEVTQFMEVKNYSHVMHIVSLVEGDKMQNKDAYDILGRFIPAGTLSGAPKIRAMEIIEELEKERRGVYGGAVGYFGFDGNMDTCIAIRTMIIKNGIAYMQAGAGIVADSIPEKEFEETENKIKALMSVLEV